MGVSFKKVRQFVNNSVFRCEERDQVAQLLNENFPYAKTFVLRAPSPWSKQDNTVPIDKLKELLNYGGGESVTRTNGGPFGGPYRNVSRANRGVETYEQATAG